MYPSNITTNEFFRFRHLLSKKGKEAIEWDIWKYTYRKIKFQALTEAFRFLGFTKERDVLSPLGKRFVFGGEDKALAVGLIQSEYFNLFKQLMSGAEPEEKLFDTFSLKCELPLSEKQRRSIL